MTDITTKPAQIFLQVDGGVSNVLTTFDFPVQDGDKVYGSSVAYGVAQALKEQLDGITDDTWKRQIRDWLFPSQPDGETNFARNVNRITGGLADMLIAKNVSYGDSALNPVRVFSKASPEEQLLVRLDDKISRISRGHEYGDDDTIRDLIGYAVLLLIAREGG